MSSRVPKGQIRRIQPAFSNLRVDGKAIATKNATTRASFRSPPSIPVSPVIFFKNFLRIVWEGSPPDRFCRPWLYSMAFDHSPDISRLAIFLQRRFEPKRGPLFGSQCLGRASFLHFCLSGWLLIIPNVLPFIQVPIIHPEFKPMGRLWIPLQWVFPTSGLTRSQSSVSHQKKYPESCSVGQCAIGFKLR